MNPPDFEALRADRNAKHEAWMKEMRADSWELMTPYNKDACYCACGNGGPCEHDWTGESYESEDGSLCSATCSRCGMTAFSHDMRNAP